MVKLILAFFYKHPSETFDRFLALYSIIICFIILLFAKMETLKGISADTIFICFTTLFVSILVFYLGQYFDRRRRKKEVDLNLIAMCFLSNAQKVAYHANGKKNYYREEIIVNLDIPSDDRFPSRSIPRGGTNPGGTAPHCN
ncbi:hypothetical protein [Olivibacter sp. XZL3]|uniref:hypothetical protein n=1 Tax=Olivibacter sp. XZL3 TaxID=1735116 RepID=UPI0010663105|nr:hypothetical protein [Olivibacter sp. XZL3]